MQIYTVWFRIIVLFVFILILFITMSSVTCNKFTHSWLQLTDITRRISFIVFFSGNFPFLSEIPENLDPTKLVDAYSFISLMCNSTHAELISDSLKNELVAAVFVNVPKLVPNLMGGYFAIKSDSKDLDELCFEPKDMLTMAQLAQLYPDFRSAKSMPFFTVPGESEHVKGVKVNLRKDKALNGGKSARGNNLLLSKRPQAWGK